MNPETRTIADPLMSAPQIEAYLERSISLTTIRRLMASGELPVIRIGSLVRVRRSSVEAYLTAKETAL